MAMTTKTAEPVSLDDAAADDLNEFGYGQDLHRSIGTYASFAAGFSFVSILTTVFQLFGFGFSFAGPFFFWTWPAVFLGQLMVALCFAELAGRYPLSGAIYQWARRLGGDVIGWFAGWTMIIAQIVTVAAAAIAMQAVLPAIWSGFQIVGGDPSIATLSGATNAIVLGLMLLIVTTLINSVAVRVMAVVNAVGVTAELIGVVLLIIALFSTSVRGPGIVLDTSGVTSFGALLAAALMAGYVLVGFDSAGELAEETHNPRRTTPKTILRALIVSGIGGGLILLGALMASPTLDDQLSSGGLAYVVTSRLGDFWGRVLLADVVLAAFVCTLAIQTATTRMIFSMSRDEVLPFSRQLRKVSHRGATVNAAVLVGVGAAILLLINLGHAGVFTALTSTCIVLLYLAYLCVTAPMLYRRLKGWPTELGPQDDELGKPVFSLGRLGTADQRAGRGVGTGDGDQPRLAAPGGLRPRGHESGAAVLRADRRGLDPRRWSGGVHVQEGCVPPGHRRSSGRFVGHEGRGSRRSLGLTGPAATAPDRGSSGHLQPSVGRRRRGQVRRPPLDRSDLADGLADHTAVDGGEPVDADAVRRSLAGIQLSELRAQPKPLQDLEDLDQRVGLLLGQDRRAARRTKTVDGAEGRRPDAQGRPPGEVDDRCQRVFLQVEGLLSAAQQGTDRPQACPGLQCLVQQDPQRGLGSSAAPGRRWPMLDGPGSP